MRALMFCGYHDTGKTSLIEKIVCRLTGRGYSVATLKHTPKHHTKVRGNHDTDRFISAGSPVTVQVTAESIVSYRRRDSKQTPGELLATLSEELSCDFLLIEGFKEYEGFPRVVFGHSKQDLLRMMTDNTVAFSGWEMGQEEIRALETELGIPYLPYSADADGLADFVERTAIPVNR